MTGTLSTWLVAVAAAAPIAGNAAAYKLRVIETAERVTGDRAIEADTALRFAGGGFDVAWGATLTNYSTRLTSEGRTP